MDIKFVHKQNAQLRSKKMSCSNIEEFFLRLQRTSNSVVYRKCYRGLLCDISLAPLEVLALCDAGFSVFLRDCKRYPFYVEFPQPKPYMIEDVTRIPQYGCGFLE